MGLPYSSGFILEHRSSGHPRGPPRESSTPRRAEKPGSAGARAEALGAGWASVAAKGPAAGPVGARPHPILGPDPGKGRAAPPAGF